MTLINDYERRKLESRRSGTYARGWHVAGILRVSVLFQDSTASFLNDSSQNHMTVSHAAENCQENSDLRATMEKHTFLNKPEGLWPYDVGEHAQGEYGIDPVIGVDGYMFFDRSAPIRRVECRPHAADRSGFQVV
jgi:hypothetical protein